MSKWWLEAEERLQRTRENERRMNAAMDRLLDYYQYVWKDAPKPKPKPEPEVKPEWGEVAP